MTYVCNVDHAETPLGLPDSAAPLPPRRRADATEAGQYAENAADGDSGGDRPGKYGKLADNLDLLAENLEDSDLERDAEQVRELATNVRAADHRETPLGMPVWD